MVTLPAISTDLVAQFALHTASILTGRTCIKLYALSAGQATTPGHTGLLISTIGIIGWFLASSDVSATVVASLIVHLFFWVGGYDVVPIGSSGSYVLIPHALTSSMEWIRFCISQIGVSPQAETINNRFYLVKTIFILIRSQIFRRIDYVCTMWINVITRIIYTM